MAVIDYRYRTEKMFDFSQLEEDHLMSSLSHLNSKDAVARGQAAKFARLSKEALSKLDCYSIEEKLNFSQANEELAEKTKSSVTESSATKSTGTVSKSDLREDAPEFHPNYSMMTGYDLFNSSFLNMSCHKSQLHFLGNSSNQELSTGDGDSSSMHG
jgi:hypothetical protein